MRLQFHPLLAAVAGLTLTTGCLATQSQLKHASDQQTAAFESERTARLAAEATLATTDSTRAAELRAELGVVRGDVQALRSELQTLRTDFGAKISMIEDGLKFAMPVNFEYDAANVRDQDRAQLERFAHVVQQYYPGSRVTIEGFADPAGSTRYNLALSQRRADAVKAYLTGQGVPATQLATIGYGETRLVVPNASRDRAGAEQNRRVVFVIETKTERAIALASPETP
jgi:outer membrane protein OmpA-like peptidoglycan-associated protein